MIVEKVSVKGYVSLVLRDSDGNIKQHETCNMVMNSGLALLTSRLIGTAKAVISHMAIGTGTTAAAKTQTALSTELVRVAITSGVQVTSTVTNDSVQYVATFAPGVGTGAITEGGLFNAASGGDLLARTVWPVVNKGASDTLTITWKVSLS